MSPAAILAAAPVDRGTGRRWLEEELRRDEYSANDLTPLERLGRWVDDVLTGLLSAALGGNSPWLLLLVVLALAAIIALIVWRVRRLGLRRAQVPVSAFDAVVAAPQPEPWRRSAQAAAARGDLRTAVADQARAIFAVLALRGLVDLDDAATASELARTAGAAVPAHAQDLHRVADVFNDLVFGEESAPKRTDDELRALLTAFVDLDAELSRLPAGARTEALR